MNESSRPRSGTAVLAENASRLRFEDIPGDVLTVAKQCVLDTIGVAIAGADEPAPRLIRDVVLPESVGGTSSILGVPGVRTAPGAAALANGVSAHVLDLDDVLTVYTGHPSVTVLPAVLALAEERGASGKDLLEAFVTGVEVEARIGRSVAPSHYLRGFHATGTIGTFGAAASSGRLLGVDADGMEMALGIAGAQAAGLKSEFGTMTKSLHAGKAAANGLLAARLAAVGFTGAADVVGVGQGFAEAYADDVEREVLGTDFGSPWYLLDALFKMYASCHYTHSVYESVRSLRDRIDVSAVESVSLRINPDLLAVCDRQNPQTGLEAKFSMRYVAALALARGLAGRDKFTDDAVRKDSDVRALATRVQVIPDANVPHFTSECVIKGIDGAHLTASHNTEKRFWRESPQEQTPAVVDKFIDLVEPAYGRARAAELAETILALESAPDVRVLGRI